METVEIKDTAKNATNYQLDDGRIYRIHLDLVTAPESIRTAELLDVVTRGYEITKDGAFVVNDNGEPIMLKEQRARIPLSNVREGIDSMKPGWIPIALPEEKEAKKAMLDEHKELKSLPKKGNPGDIKRKGKELFSWTDGLYEAVRRSRLGEVTQTPPEPLSDEEVDAMLP